MKLKIELSNAGRSGGVFIDGAQVPNVRAVEFRAGVGEMPVAVLTLVNPDVEIVADMEAKGVSVRTEPVPPSSVCVDLDAAVEAGRFTRAEADGILARVRAKFDELEKSASKIEYAP